MASILSSSDVAMLSAFTRFENDDVTNELARVAYVYLNTYDGTFPFLLDLRARSQAGEVLSVPQLRGVLNCILSDIKRASNARATTSTSTRVPTHVDIEDGYYTIVLPNDQHRTLRVKHHESEPIQFVSYLRGADNTRDYTCCGIIRNNVYSWTQKYAHMRTSDDSLAVAVRTLIRADAAGRHAAGYAYALRSSNCYRCNRDLTDPISIATGLGPICRDALGIEPADPATSDRRVTVSEVSTRAMPASTVIDAVSGGNYATFRARLDARIAR